MFVRSHSFSLGVVSFLFFCPSRFFGCIFFLIFLLPIFLFPVQFCKMPVFYLELFASHCFGPRRVFQLALFFFIFVLAIVSSQSILVRCQFFLWSCLLPLFVVRFLFLRCHFVYFFASHVSSHSIFVRCQFFFWSGLLPILSVRFLFLKCHFFFDFFVSHFLFPVHFCQMPVFHLELFASHFFRPIPFSKVPFFF